MDLIDTYIADRREAAVEAWRAWRATRREWRGSELDSLTRTIREQRAIRHFAAYRLLRDDVDMLRLIRKEWFGVARP